MGSGRQILSIMAGVTSYKAIQTFIPEITPYRCTTANVHGLQYGRAASVPKKDAPRLLVNRQQLEHCLSFISSPHLVQDLPSLRRITQAHQWRINGGHVELWLRRLIDFLCFYIPISNARAHSKCLLRLPLGLFSTGTVFFSEAGLIFVVKLGGKFKLDLRSKSYFKSSLPVTKWTKHGSTSLHIPCHDPPLDITVFSDVSRNPGPEVLHFEPTTRTHSDLHPVSSRPKNEVFKE